MCMWSTSEKKRNAIATIQQAEEQHGDHAHEEAGKRGLMPSYQEEKTSSMLHVSTQHACDLPLSVVCVRYLIHPLLCCSFSYSVRII